MTNEEIKNSNSIDVDYELATPMFKQFLDIKRKYQEVVLLYRMGDFYEGFFEDAIIFSKVLGLTLTHKDGGAIGKVPMAGIPVKSLNMYIPKLLNENIKVAICEQLENPKDAKGLVKRDIVKTITAGTITEVNLLEPTGNNFLASIINVNNIFGLAYTDISTGEFKVTKGSLEEILSELARIKPAEILTPIKKQKIMPFQIVPEEKIDLPDSITAIYPCTKMPLSSYDEDNAIKRIKEVFNVVSLEAFGFEEFKPAFFAAGAMIDYILETQKGVLPKFDVIKPYSISEFVSIDASTRRNLELIETSRDKSKYGSLYWAIDKVKTPMGSRLLKSWITQPIKNIDELNTRLSAVEELINNFCDNFYMDAAPYVKAVLNSFRVHSAHLKKTYPGEYGGKYSHDMNMYYTKYWPKDLMEQWNDLFAQGLKAIEKYQYSDPALYNVLYKRVSIEKMSPIYILLHLYPRNLSTDVHYALGQEFKRYAVISNLSLGEFDTPMEEIYQRLGIE